MLDMLNGAIQWLKDFIAKLINGVFGGFLSIRMATPKNNQDDGLLTIVALVIVLVIIPVIIKLAPLIIQKIRETTGWW